LPLELRGAAGAGNNAEIGLVGGDETGRNKRGRGKGDRQEERGTVFDDDGATAGREEEANLPTRWVYPQYPF
jgi:hypothetical protein